MHVISFGRLAMRAVLRAVVSVILVTNAGAAFAQAVGDQVLNPITKENETVDAVFQGGVLTNKANIILTNVMIDDVYIDPADDTKTVTVKSLILTDGVVTGFKAKDTDREFSVVIDASASINGGGGGATGPGDLPTNVTPATNDRGFWSINKKGGKGDDGSGGGGVCFFVCLAKKAEAGGPGDEGPKVTETISTANPATSGSGTTITTVTDGLNGVLVSSVGGDGGEGGSFGGVNVGGGDDGNGGAGGKAGAGGQAKANVAPNISITTSGKDAKGLFVQSRSGSGGDAGGGYGISSGGAGGNGGVGGTAEATNRGTIKTTNSGAIGILSQSLGGSSGRGGDSFGLVGTAGGSLPAGDGGTAKATNSGAVTTQGKAAHGVSAQSVGGSGGSGGTSGQLFVALQDNPGGGGDGGATTATNTGTIATKSDGAHGLLSMSTGGNGGDGGVSGSLVVSLGGSSGAGGTGGTATATMGTGGQIQTEGKGAFGIFAQSVGGGGGNGGVGAAIVALGGSGGGGGDGAAVSITTTSGSGTNKSTVKTTGAASHGLFAQSVGGGGGTGGVAGAGVAIGGSGGTGNDGGAVTVSNQSDIETTGFVARGIFAESIGGGGGAANAAGGIVSVGGSGDAGGKAGSVTVSNSGAITTKSIAADAILAQSVGGGGGDGATSGGLVAVGGKSQAGGAGGTVSVGNSGAITTDGALARGIFAQSVGGGGGTGGTSGGAVAVGGGSSKSSDGGSVSVTNSGTITTSKAMADAIFAQSIGGGGGSGGSAGGLITVGGSGSGGGNSKTVTVTNNQNLTTGGDDANGIFAQSVGGGGGSGGNAYSGSAFVGVAVGGNGGTGGDGAKAEVILNRRAETVQGNAVQVSPKIATNADRAKGVFVQSVGGGGGNGGSSVQITAGLFGSVSVAVGGSGAKGGAGKEAKLTGNAHITTKGDNAEGILAQSVGGGGGSGGLAVSGSLAIGVKGAVSIAVGVGGTGGGGGTGGDVTLDSRKQAGSIKTEGFFAPGATVQSIGGGGGSGGNAVAVSLSFSDGVGAAVSAGVGGTGGKGGTGGTVKATYDGNIDTKGNDSEGILAQSVGGGGGNGGYSISGAIGGGGVGGVAVPIGVGGSGDTGGDGGAVTANVTGNITTKGTRSDGVSVQSQGGGGGQGGFNVSGAIAVGEKGAAAVPIGVGGYGKGGGQGGTVIANVTGNITTGDKDAIGALAGSQSNGFVAQSVGGGGGTGGFNVSGGLSIGKGAAVGIGVGGSGGKASDGGTVTATMKGDVTIYGSDAAGILVQSAGGGGGSGAFNVTGTGAGGEMAGAVSIGVGGTGGGGGTGGQATLTSNGSVTTHADRSDAIVVESQGGGGGNGAFNVSGSVALGSKGAAAVGFGIGGFGGDGGASKLARANISGGAVLTHGESARGVVVQSVGGGGGNGAFNVTGTIAGSSDMSAAIGVGIGGYGGKASKGGAAQATIDNSIETKGKKSAGVIVQSVGGGGGNGAFNVTAGIAGAKNAAGVLGVGVGGFGAGGGDGDAVTGILRGAVTTRETDANAVVIQSNGGGGGNGAFNVTGGISGAKTAAGVVGIGVGGFGGGGGDGGIVNATIRGAILTEKARSGGLLVQSQGGGGGNGAFNVTASATGSKSISGVGGVGVGGFGDGGGDGKTVTATLKAPVTTRGAGSSAVTIQSLGGGGGNGAFNVTGGIALSKEGAGGLGVGVGGYGGTGGNAGAVTAGTKDDPNKGKITTSGDLSHGLLVQSQGGGGGAGAFNITGTATAAGDVSGALSVGVGGKGGGGGHGAKVIAHHDGKIETKGALAFGTTVQSVGGGGGTGAFNVTGTISLTKPSGLAAASVGVGVGGSGGKAGHGGVVEASHTGDVVTAKESSHGVLFQSEGGGGGNGGFNVTGAITGSLLSGSLGIGVGGAGAGGGNADMVTGAVTGNVETKADLSPGIIVQSSGGGGGVGAFNVTGGISFAKGISGTVGVGVGGFGGGGGASGVVTGAIKGDVRTAGDKSRGILVQSAAGGGGAGGFNIQTGINIAKDGAGAFGLGIGGFGGNGGAAKNVSGSATGIVATTGANSDGVLVQSQGGGGGAGGINVTGNVALTSKSTAAAASIGIGGFGGSGGDAGTVVFTRSGVTTTEKSNSDGVVIQSVGGGGGKGGLNVTGNVTGSAKGSAGGFGFGIGGFGGAGGTGDDVTARVTGDVRATGADAAVAKEVDDGIKRILRENGSNGIIVQSISDGGGAGGINVTGTLSLSKEGGSGRAANIGIGGAGGKGGSAGKVDLIVSAQNVIATGDDTSGVAAQSIGGGGGHGAINVTTGIATGGNVNLGVGGFGTTGGSAKAVTAQSTTAITVTGASSRGFVAQSIGGGGGAGGINVTAGLQKADGAKDPNITLGIGGFGGAGGAADTVTARQTGAITATGYQSIGALVQSIGGGGGMGAINIMGNGKIGKGYAAALNIGGSGGSGAVAKDVSFVNDGAITVDGRTGLPDEFTALAAAQSKAASAGLMKVAEEKDESVLDMALNFALDAIGRASDPSFADRSNGVLVQSIGGGGGHGGVNLTALVATKANPGNFTVGGFGGTGSDAGNVTVTRGQTNATTLATIGKNAHALVAQSVGGGGGQAGVNLAGTLGTTSDAEASRQLSFALGGDGGNSGKGKATTVTHTGTITTNGQDSKGILAQSVGGGGGNANFNVSLGRTNKSSGMNLAIGGDPGDGSDGGAVTVTHSGKVATIGKGSTALHAQSIGGGGGNANFNVATSISGNNALNVAIGRPGGKAAKAGKVTVNSTGEISTNGLESSGIMAQSIANGGGNSGTVGFDFGLTNGLSDTAASVSGGVQVGLKGADGGVAGEVAITAAGTITTSAGKSHGIAAESIGGGGGRGGTTLATNIGDTFSATVGVGGAGGTGGIGGTVTVNSSATIATKDVSSHGISAESFGGGGGTGGYAAAVTFNGAANKVNGANELSVNVGGAGGAGNDGGVVTVTHSGTITTAKDDSMGIKAQSLGKGGGNGGAVLAGTLGVKGGDGAKMSLRIGGAGGDGSINELGNLGNAVTVTNTGLITTAGDRSNGIEAASRGGGGGNGGLVAQVRLDRPDNTASRQSYSLTIGGTGGTGATGGTVTVNNSTAQGRGTITTTGKSAHGIYAESLGGGGGVGSAVLDVAISGGKPNDKNAYNLGLNIGGKGGKGNIGGTIAVTNSGTISTSGEAAHGIAAKSLGGGGGDGGIAISARSIFKTDKPAAAITIGGIGGSGGDGGDVTVTNTGKITVTGKNAVGILGQSIGGGGGNSQLGLGLDLSSVKNGLGATILNSALSASIGGIGMAAVPGGKAGTVTITHDGDVTATGDGGAAYRPQMINGGGGSLTVDFGALTSLAGTPIQKDPAAAAQAAAPTDADNHTVAMTVGGENNTDMSGGAIQAESKGAFVTQGANSHGINSQNVGGGGGSVATEMALVSDQSFATGKVGISTRLGGSGGSGNAGGSLTGGHTGAITTRGLGSMGIMAQSIGGGGGEARHLARGNADALGAVSLALGGLNQTNAPGGAVARTDIADIATDMDQAHGMVLQSIGGGGGAITLALRNAAGTASETASVALGGTGGSGLGGGTVRAEHTGTIRTSGADAVGILAQSIGAGGGMARLAGLNSVAASLGGTGGSTGDGNSVALTHSGAVTTSGVRSHGFVLQSIGGGGGTIFGDGGPFAVTRATANSGNGAAVSLITSGGIVTSGAGAAGVVLQSLGGGGGIVGDAFSGSAGGKGAGGTVALAATGDIRAAAAPAIIAQSLGTTGRDAITLDLGAGREFTGKTTIALDGGTNNAIRNRGRLTNVDAIDGFAMTATTGDDRIENTGFILGKLALGGGANALRNAAGGEVHAGAMIDLGAATNPFSNDGLVAPGGAEFALQAAVNGSFAQSAGAEFNGELDFATDVLDALLATGEVAAAGTFDVDLLSIPVIKPGDFEKPLLTSGTALTAQDPILETAPSVVILYDLVEKPTELALAFAVDFQADGLQGNQNALGDYFNRVQTAGSDPTLADTVTELVNAPDLAIYSGMLTQLGSEIYAEQQVRDMSDHTAFARGVSECSMRGKRVATGPQGRCFWFDGTDMDILRQNKDGFPEIRHSDRLVTTGLEFRTRDGNRLAIGLGNGTGSSRGFDGAWAASTARYHIGAALTSAVGPSRRVVSFSLGKAASTTSRAIAVTQPVTARSSRTSILASASMRQSRTYEQDGFWITPGIELGVGMHHGKGFREDGAGAQNLVVDSKTNTRIWAVPGAEIGTSLDLGPNARLDLTGSLAYEWSASDGQSTTLARLTGAPEAVAPFAMSSAIGAGLVRASLGARLTAGDGLALSVRIGTERSDLRRTDFGEAAFSVPF